VSDARIFTVDDDDDGIRLDRWFKRHMPEVSFNLVSRWARTGQLRLAGKKAVPGDRIEAGQEIRVPPMEAQAARAARPQGAGAVLTEDEAHFVG
jgi:23S rRNA pseudouridine955/2504/2580 synthase